MVHPSQRDRSFGRRRELPEVIIKRGGRISTFVIRPWLSVGVIAVFLTFGAGYMGSTGYLIYRDGILDASMARQAEIEYAYEDRIALLRSEIDRVTSRHLVETQSIESNVEALLNRQDLIRRRQAVLDTLIARARKEGIRIASSATPIPIPRPTVPGSKVDPVVTGSIGGTGAIRPPQREAEAFRPVLRDIQSSLDRAEKRQVAAVDFLSAATGLEADRLSRIVTRLGIKVPRTVSSSKPEQATGGPFIPAGQETFVERLAELDEALTRLNAVRAGAEALPIRSPIPGARMSSRFGRRMDPFLKRPAMHSGVDFKAKSGTPVRSTAKGKVVFAGRKGGYGRLVEIQHAHGMTTRYAHLSRISVRRGGTVDAGTIIGRVGSTGRSTGPHLHYETRRSGKATDPARFMRAGISS